MGRSRREELVEFADHGFKVPEAWTPDLLARQEAARYRRFAMMAVFAAEFPRRLGQSVDDEILAADKRLSRSIAHTYLKLWQRLTMARKAPLPAEELETELLPPNDWKALHKRAAAIEAVRREGATVDWPVWWEDLRPKLVARRMAVATFALDRDLYGWGSRVVSSITNEVEWVGRRFDGS